MDFNVYYTSKITCPHCGYEHKDSWEMDFGPTVYCRRCEEEFNVSRNVEVNRTSFPIKK